VTSLRRRDPIQRRRRADVQAAIGDRQCRLANVASNWLRWQFKRDKQASKMFVGKDCSLCTNSNWDTASKRLK
jgi:hypothetical protein